MEQIELSGVMVTYNEEKFVGEALDQLIPLVDEMIVLDGGSTDQTVLIAKERNCKVYRFPWRDHFADQKNLAISFATGRWIFLLDPDERLDQNLVDNIRKLICEADDTGTEVIQLPRKNYLDGEQTDADPDYQLRLFRCYCRYIFPVHEELVGWSQMSKADGCHLLHYKTKERQVKQCRNYDRLMYQSPQKFKDGKLTIFENDAVIPLSSQKEITGD